MEAVDKRTGEVIEIHPELATEQQRLFGGFEQVEVFALAVTGASDLDGDEDLVIGQDIEVTIRGRVVKLGHEVKWDKDADRELLIRRATIKAKSGRVTRAD